MSNASIAPSSIGAGSQADISAWFDRLVSALRGHELMMTTGTASEQTQNLYNVLMHGDHLQMASMSRAMGTAQYIQAVLLDYLQAAAKRLQREFDIWMDLSDSTILVWTVVGDDAEDDEDAFLLAEAEVNAKYASSGFAISTMVVEASDSLKAPNHYQHLHVG